MKNYIKKLLSYQRSIMIFTANKNNRKVKYQNLNINYFNSKKKISNFEILKYLDQNKKHKRFIKKHTLIVLTSRKKILCYGWKTKKKRWFIEEIQKKININDHLVLFDFYTPKKYRNKGYYTKILKLIRNVNDKFLIYCLSNNSWSRRAIINSGFRFEKRIKK